MDNTNCNICNRKFHNHAKIVECVSCHIRYHLKCITLECEHQAYILFHLLEWICETCNSLIFPFNQLESDNDFLHWIFFIILPCWMMRPLYPHSTGLRSVPDLSRFENRDQSGINVNWTAVIVNWAAMSGNVAAWSGRSGAIFEPVQRLPPIWEGRERGVGQA